MTLKWTRVIVVAAIACTLACLPQIAFAEDFDEADVGQDATIEIVDVADEPAAAFEGIGADGEALLDDADDAADLSAIDQEATDAGELVAEDEAVDVDEGDDEDEAVVPDEQLVKDSVSDETPVAISSSGSDVIANKPASTQVKVRSQSNKPATQQSVALEAAAQTPEPTLVTQAPAPLAEGAYVIKVKSTYGVALGTGGSFKTSALKAENVDGAYDQVFYFQLNTSGLYAIFSVASGLAIDASQGNVRQASYSGSNHQLFEIRKAGSGYAIVSKAGRAVVVSGSAVKTGAYSASSSAQRFAFVEAPLVIPGVQVLYASGSTTSAMGVAGSSRNQGAACQSNTYSGAEGQMLTVARSGSGYQIKPVSSGMGFAPSGSNVTQQTKSFTWQPKFAKSGSRRGLAWVDSSTGKAMQVSGTSVKMASFTGAAAQSFLPLLKSVVTDGCFNIKNLAAGTVLELQGGNWVNGGNVSLYTSNGTGAQYFNVKSVGSGLFRIINAMTGYTLSAPGSNVYQHSYSGAYNQLWVPIASKSGGIAWINAATGRALNASGTSAGANASAVSPTYAKAQSWTMVKGSYESDPVLQTAMEYVTSSYSQTGYQIMVDRHNCRTVVAEKSGGVWRPIYNWTCTPGAPSTPTVGGSYTVGIRGYSFDGALGGTPYTCYYYTQFWGDYLFHSLPYYQGTWTVQDGRLGQMLSHGCVRLETSNAKWIYDNIPGGTYVYVYN